MINIKAFMRRDKNKYSTYLIYIICLIVVVIIKLFYRNASSSSLLFILTPVTKLVEIFAGIPFYLFEGGYLSFDGSVEISAGCAGINFLVILFCTLVFSFIGQFCGSIKKVGMLFVFLMFSYIITIIVNTFRIVSSINISKFNADWLGLDSLLLHKITGALVYFFFLALCYIGMSKFISFLGRKNMETFHKTLERG